MTAFTPDNWAGTDDEIETANLAFDEAWGAIKGLIQRDGLALSDDEYQVRHSLADAINNEFGDDISAADLAEAALKRMGYTPKRTIYSLECK